MKKIIAKIDAPFTSLVVIAASFVLITYVDYLTPPELPIAGFFVFPIWMSTRLFGLGGGGVAAVVSLVSYYGATYVFGPAEGHNAMWASLFLNELFFILFALASYFFLLNQSRLKQAHADLEVRLNELHQLHQESQHLHQQNLQLAVIEERNRLAREMHDVLAQGLTAILLQVDAAFLNMGNPEILKLQLGQIKQTAHYNLQEARRSVSNLRPLPLEGLSLSEALARKVQEFGAKYQIGCSYTASEGVKALPVEVETALLRIMQEALNNVSRHAEASEVKVNLDYDEDEVWLTISDNGCGFVSNNAYHDPAQQAEPTFGLSTMQERAQLVGGWVAVQSEPNQGCRVRAIIPYQRAESIA